MGYDNGEVLQGLNEPWTFVGANVSEWLSGLMMFFVISVFSDSPAKIMPLMLIGWLSTTVTLATIRRMFPDEERGVRNAMLTACGVPPPGIPLPASLQPVWSQCPTRELSEKSKFQLIGLDTLYRSFERNLSEAEKPAGIDGSS